MSIPAVANVGLNLLLIPRLGLTGAMGATTASYGLGLAASIALGRLARPLPLPWAEALKAGAASLVMAAVVMRVPAFGGAVELLAKAGVGALVYAPGGLRARRRRACAAARGRPCGILRARMAHDRRAT